MVGGIYDCAGQCETGDAACAEACYGEATTQAQALYDEADACFASCADDVPPQNCWADNCTDLGASCFLGSYGMGDLSCEEALSCLNDCATTVDPQSCSMECLHGSTAEAQSQFLGVQWCLVGACSALDPDEDVAACQNEAAGPGGVCEAHVSACLALDVP